MAITLKTDYRKTLGLPGYSSHSFSAAVEVEISNIEDAPREIQELYMALQQNVDNQIQNPGFIPPSTYGMEEGQNPPASLPAALTTEQPSRNVTPQASAKASNAWNCSDKQRELILKIIAEKNLVKSEIESLSIKLFGRGVRALTKLEASGLIKRLCEIDSKVPKARRKGVGK